MALPLSSIPKICALYNSSLGADITSSATSFTVVTGTDDAGEALTGVFGFTIDGEFIVGTKSGTSVTGCLRGVNLQDGTTEVTALKAAHIRGTPVVITDAPFLAIVYRILNGNEGAPNQLKYVSSGYPTPTAAYDIPTKAYVDAVAGGTPATFDALVAAGTAGETVSAGQLLYFDTGSNNEWMKCDADTAASVDNVILGIAQGAGTDGNAITSGVLLWGLDENQSGLTQGDPLFASNTAGAISSSAGTVEVSLGAAKSATTMYFSPRYNQQITEDQQDALAGSSGTPSSTNKYVTQADASRVYYAATVVGTDSYAVTPAIAQTLANGLKVRIKLDVANTGPATFNYNAGGALAIVKGVSTALVTGDMVANKIIELTYNSTGTVWQLGDTPNSLMDGSNADGQHAHSLAAIVPLSGYVSVKIDQDVALTEALNGGGHGFSSATNTLHSVSSPASASGATVSAALTGSTTGDLTWSNAVILNFGLTSTSGDISASDGFIGMGALTDTGDVQENNVLVKRHVAILVLDGVPYASCADGTTQTTPVQLATIITTPRNYTIVWTPGVSAAFYVNGVLTTTLTTNLPTGATDYGAFRVGIEGDATAKALYFTDTDIYFKF